MKQFLPALSVCALLSAQAVAQTTITGPSTKTTPYQYPTAPGVSITSILTVGDTVNGYRMVGIPDGIGGWDNGNGTWTLLVNHELGNNVGAIRAHGSRGAFVSKWVLTKNSSNMQVLSGQDLTQRVHLYNPANNSWTAYGTNNPLPATTAGDGLGRFCSGDVPPVSAFYNAATGMGTQERFIMNGEETGVEGKGFAHLATGPNAGNTYELPHVGKMSFENLIASPRSSDTTVVIGTDDGTGGQVYVYVGMKQNTGNEITRAGLVGGKLYAIAVTGMLIEPTTGLINNTMNFTLVPFDTVHKMTGATLNTLSVAAGATTFQRPEDGAWDPRNPADFYFLTTASTTTPSRLWRVRFTHPGNPALGGTITAVMDGTEGQLMMDNMTIDNWGHILIQEDVGNNAHLGRTLQYNIATDSVKYLLTHDSVRFKSGVNPAAFITQDEEASGIIDVQEILGAGWFFGVDQIHGNIGGELVERGQMFLMYNPDTYNANPEISLTGNGQNIPNNSTAPVTANNTDFGNISTGGMMTRTFTITNGGPASLTVTGINISGANAGEFTIVGGPTFPLRIAANGTQNITVQFAPTAVGLRTANLNISSNDFDESAYSVALRGVALNAAGVAALAGGSALKLYPNPTGDAATIDLSLKAGEQISVSMFDLNGRQVIAPIARNYPAGEHKLTLNTSNLSNGTYYVQMEAGNHITRMKLVVLH